jgi:peptidoglycan hydrolase-like protein with peptidoglycan-binding domain
MDAAERSLAALAAHLDTAAHRLAGRLGALGRLPLGPGSAGPAVASVQRMLLASGFVPGPVDGDYGPRTTDAVAALQRVHGLPVDGVVGTTTALVVVVHADGPPLVLAASPDAV